MYLDLALLTDLLSSFPLSGIIPNMLRANFHNKTQALKNKKPQNRETNKNPESCHSYLPLGNFWAFPRFSAIYPQKRRKTNLDNMVTNPTSHWEWFWQVSHRSTAAAFKWTVLSVTRGSNTLTQASFTQWEETGWHHSLPLEKEN